MTKYEFTLILRGSPELTEELADNLFAAGCDDATPGMFCGQTVMDFHREAESLEAALRSAIHQVMAAGETVESVQLAADPFAVPA